MSTRKRVLALIGVLAGVGLLVSLLGGLRMARMWSGGAEQSDRSGLSDKPDRSARSDSSAPAGRRDPFLQQVAQWRREWSERRRVEAANLRFDDPQQVLWLASGAFSPAPGVTATTTVQQPTPRNTLPYIVQFSGPVRDEWKSDLEAHGAKLRGYIPENAFLCEGSPNDAAQWGALGFVRAVAPYEPTFKVEPFLQELARLVEAQQTEADGDIEWPQLEVRIQTLSPDDAPIVAELLRNQKIEVLDARPARRWGQVLARIVPRKDVLSAIAALGAIQWIEEATPREWHNDFAVEGRHLNVTNVWVRYGLTGRRQVIGHADTGLDSGSLTNLHPDFVGRVRWVIARGRPGDWSDTHGHGTHTAGSILGDGAASTGQFRGVAFEAELVHQSVMDAGGGLGGLPYDLYELYQEAYTNAARIHSDSWGAAVYGQYNADSQSSDEFMWDNQDMLLVFSAGNEGRDSNANGVVDPDSIGSPGTAKNLLTVGAAESDRAPGSGGYSSMAWGYGWPSQYPVDPIRNDYISQSADLINQGLAAFSSRGPTDDGRVKPDVVSPGTDVISCRSRRASSSAWGLHPNTNYMFSGGTSMAAPLLAGFAALVRQYYMEWRGVTNPSAALVKATLINGARSLTPGQYGTGAAREIPAPPRPNNAEGWGQPNLENTLFPAGAQRLSACDTNRLSTGQTNDYRLFLTAGVSSAVTLAYSDYPGTVGAGKTLVNDLDLLVLSPTGGVLYPNGLSGPDRTNNVEGLDFVPPVTGLWTVRVVGFNVPNGPQPYALVFRGGWRPVTAEPVGNTTNTAAPYELRAWITALGAQAPSSFMLMWNTNGSSRFNTNVLENVAGPVYRGWVPPQPTNTTVYYFFEAFLEGQTFRWPTGAPNELLSFRVTAPVLLSVSGTPVEAASPQPPYGAHALASGTIVTAGVAAATTSTNGFRYACSGWVGTGSVPASGTNNSVIFTLGTNSTLTWQWNAQVALDQTSQPSGLVATTTWWAVGATGATVAAPSPAAIGGTNWMFAQWRVDGARWPGATNRAQNPAFGIAMTTARTAVAEYLPETQDADTNGLADWWEFRHFGNTGIVATADSDGDGFDNQIEFLDGSDPTDATSVPLPPVIMHTPLAASQTTPAPWRVTASVADSGTVASVKLGWTRNGGARQEVPMFLAGGVYTNAIPSPGTNGDVFIYDIVATDAAGLTATSGPYSVSAIYGVLTVAPSGTQTVWTTPGGETSIVFAASNIGNTGLVWSVRFTPSPTSAVGWWSAAVTGGILSAGSGTQATISLSGAGMTTGASRTLFADWLANTPVQPSNRVTVVLRAGLPPTIVSVSATNTADTNGPYVVEAVVTPAALVDTNNLFVLWNTNGSFTNFATTTMSRGTGDLYRAFVPGQPRGTRIHYFVLAVGTNTLSVREPPNAPYALRQFDVVSPITLTVTGVPAAVGTVVPVYGSETWPSGVLIVASAPAMVSVSDGERYQSAGWTGTGSVPPAGATTQTVFVLNQNSVLSWQWTHEFRLRQTSSVSGAVQTDVWWNASAAATTVVAPDTHWLGGTRYRFAEWRVDGVRVPASGPAANPATGVAMSTARTAVAIYYADDADSDGDGLPDWWIARYGFAGAARAPVAMYWFDKPMGHELVLDGGGAISLGSRTWSATQSFSVALWLRPTTNVGVYGIVGSTGSVQWALYQRDSNLCAAIYSAGGATTTMWLQVLGVMEPGRWRHVAWIYQAPTSSALFVDGLPAATGSPSGLFDFTSDDVLGRAELPDAGALAWSGRVDDFAVWTQTLSAAEVEALYKQGRWPDKDSWQRLAFNADAGGVATDLSGNNRHGLYVGSATTEVTTLLWDHSGRGHHGAYENAIWANDAEMGEIFYAEGGNYAKVPHAPTLMPTSQVSVVARIRPEELFDWHTIAVKAENDLWADGYGLYARGNSVTQWVAFINDFDARGVRAALNTGTWLHAAGVYDGTQLQLWANGSLAGASNMIGGITPNSGPLFMGGYAAQWGLVGRMREVRIYTNALSTSEVAAARLTWDDADGDGWPNVQEFYGGSDPNDSNSVPVAPAIGHIPLSDPQTSPAPWLVTAVVTSLSPRVEAQLWWRRNGGSWNVGWMTNAGSVFTGWLLPPGVDGDAFEYRIEVRDAAGLASTSGLYAFSVYYPIAALAPTNLELNWLLPGAATTRVAILSNTGSAPLTWRVEVESAGLPLDDVELGAGAWTHGGTNDLWRVSTNRSVSPTHAWYAGNWDSPGYENGMNAWLVNGPVFIPQGARLRFEHWIESEVDENNPPYAHDGGLVEISTNGTDFTPIVPDGGYPYRAHGLYGSPFARDTGIFAGTGGWTTAVFDLTAFAGKMVWIRFRFGSDSAFTVGEGWYVDNIEVVPAHRNDGWLALPITNGVVSGGSASNIQILLNAGVLNAGDSRAARLLWIWNDPTQSFVRVPVSLFVGRPVDLQHDPLWHTTVTNEPYGVSAVVEPLGLFDTSSLNVHVVWSTNAGASAWTNPMAGTTGNAWTGAIPAQPYGAEVAYYIRAEAAGVAVFHPSNAPTAWHSFRVRPPVLLSITGAPALYGSPQPAYGDHVMPLDVVITARAPDQILAGTWWSCTGWTGTGSAPALGATNFVSFQIDTSSVIRWHWNVRHLLLQTSSPPGILSNSDWLAQGVVTQTLVAPLTAIVGITPYRFVEWQLNGVRQGTGKAANPSTGIVMTSAQYAAAIYWPESQDSDGDGLPDAWEMYYFNTLAWGAGDDPDADGFSNAVEFGENTDPTDALSVPARPTIVHTPLTDLQTTPPPWIVSAIVTDNLGLASVPLSGYALAFTSTAHYAIRSSMRRFPTSAITVEFWIKTSDRARRGTPFSYAVSGGFADANEFTLYNHNTFLIYRGSVYTNTRISAADGFWHHIAATWRASDGRTRLYKDGELVFESVLQPGVAIRPEGCLVLGQDQDSFGGGFSADDAFIGALDEVRIWNIERSGADIRSTMSNRLTGAETGLVSYWTMEEATGATARDSGPGGNDVTLVGAVWTNENAFSGPNVRLFWNRNSNAWQSAFMTGSGADVFEARIEPPARHGDRFEYRIEAGDRGGLMATSGIHTFNVALAEISYTPGDFTNVWLTPEATTNRFLVISNSGAGALSWALTVEPYGFTDDVEGGTNGWISSGVNNQWHISSARSYSPTRAWYFGDESAGTYLNNADAFLVTPPISLGPGAQLTFRHWCDLEMQSTSVAWDGAIVEISTNRGISFATLTPVGGYPYTVNGGWGQPFPGGTAVFAGWGGWTQAVFDLSAFAGTEAQLRFRVGSDQVNDYPAEGWFIDDVVVTPTTVTGVWFAASATSGVLAVGASTSVVLTFSAAGLSAGNLLAQKLVLSSGDSFRPTNRIPMVLRVGLQPAIVHEPLGNQPVTSASYTVSAVITPQDYLNTNRLFVLWNTNGVGHAFQTSLMTRVTGDVYRAQIPARPPGTRIHYYILATAGADITTVHPAGAPATLHSFEITDLIWLTVTGSPSQVGYVNPSYGRHQIASGGVVTATAMPSDATGGTRWAAAGWTGTGSVPPTGMANSVTFTCRVDSTLIWQWQPQYLLSQTTTLRAGVFTGTWWFAGTTASTIEAAGQITDLGTNYYFAHWLVDDARQPDTTNIAVNPAGGLLMTQARTAVAVYVAEFTDLDGDDLPDWWEYRYFGGLGQWRTNDPDGDGFSNLTEFRDQTNPRDAASYPQPPHITHVPLSDPQTTPAPWTISAVVTDNAVVVGARLRWRRNSGTWQESALTGGAANAYSGVIPTPSANGDLFSYYIEASDGAGLASTTAMVVFNVALPGLRVSPTNLGYVFLAPNASTSFWLQVWNEGGADLAWTASVGRVGFWDGVEEGTNGWSCGGASSLWHIGTARVYSGSAAWYGGNAATRTYANNMNAWLASPVIILPTGAVLRFASWMDSEIKNATEAYDGGIVELSVTGGAFFAIEPRGGYPYRIAEDSDGPFTNGTPCMAGTGGWQHVEFDLTAWGGLAAQVRFRFGSDSSKTREGWYVDDIGVYPGTGDRTWLSMAPTSGMLPAAWTTLVFGSIQSTGKQAGSWWPANICVAGGAGAGASTISVVMVVYGGPTDFDGDGMPDEWEITWGFDPSNSADGLNDADGDGQANWAEFVGGTDPRNANSYFRIENIEWGTGLRVQFAGVSGRTYRLQFTTNLLSSSWSNVATNVVETNALRWLEDLAPAIPRRYYRITIER